jgi:hypothetical protein
MYLGASHSVENMVTADSMTEVLKWPFRFNYNNIHIVQRESLFVEVLCNIIVCKQEFSLAHVINRP